MGLYQIIDHLLKSAIVVVIIIVAMVILMVGLCSRELGTGGAILKILLFHP